MHPIKQLGCAAKYKINISTKNFDIATNPSSSEAEIKTVVDAIRKRLMTKLHPDKTAHLSAAEREAQTNDFKLITDAWQKIDTKVSTQSHNV